MPKPSKGQAGLAGEVEECAHGVFLELTRGAPRTEPWYGWYLCERHGGVPLLDPDMPTRQVAYWDGSDIVVASRAARQEIGAALPEELAHRLTSSSALRFELMNYRLRYARFLDRADFHERVGQRVAELFAESARIRSSDRARADGPPQSQDEAHLPAPTSNT